MKNQAVYSYMYDQKPTWQDHASKMFSKCMMTMKSFQNLKPILRQIFCVKVTEIKKNPKLEVHHFINYCEYNVINAIFVHTFGIYINREKMFL